MGDESRSADDVWLDAMEARDLADRDNFVELRAKALEIYPHHEDALMSEIRELFSRTGPRGDRPTKMSLQEAAKGLHKCRIVIAENPENEEAWAIGGRLLVDELGMFEDALQWWDSRRTFDPKAVVPLVEQVAILAEFGEYAEAADRIDLIFGENMEQPDPKSMMRLRTMSEQIKMAAANSTDFFRPNNPSDEGWIRIKAFSSRKPTTETFWLLTFLMPLVWIEAIGFQWLQTNGILSGGFSTMVLGFLIIFASFLYGSRWVKRHVHRLNRPAHELTRAINAELSSGLLCIPNEYRESRLYRALRDKRSISSMERLDRIIENGERMSRKWTFTLPIWAEILTIPEEE